MSVVFREFSTYREVSVERGEWPIQNGTTKVRLASGIIGRVKEFLGA